MKKYLLILALCLGFQTFNYSQKIYKMPKKILKGYKDYKSRKRVLAQWIMDLNIMGTIRAVGSFVRADNDSLLTLEYVFNSSSTQNKFNKGVYHGRQYNYSIDDDTPLVLTFADGKVLNILPVKKNLNQDLTLSSTIIHAIYPLTDEVLNVFKTNELKSIKFNFKYENEVHFFREHIVSEKNTERIKKNAIRFDDIKL